MYIYTYLNKRIYHMRNPFASEVQLYVSGSNFQNCDTSDIWRRVFSVSTFFDGKYL